MTDDLVPTTVGINGFTFYLCPTCGGRLSHPPDLIPCFSCIPTETLPDPTPTDDPWDFPISLSLRQSLPTPEQEIRQKTWEELQQQFQESRGWWQEEYARKTKKAVQPVRHKRKPPLAPMPPRQALRPTATERLPGGIPL